tara:strand:- start:13 stop:462 length:450 start_codon:yes stop_codon:yes gene_type:complete
MSNTITITSEQITFAINWAELRREVYNFGANYVFETGEDCFPRESYYEYGEWEREEYPWTPQEYYIGWIKQGTDKWNSGIREVPSLSSILTEDLYFDCPNCLQIAKGDRLEIEGCDVCDEEGEMLKYTDDGTGKRKNIWYDEKNDCGIV